MKRRVLIIGSPLSGKNFLTGVEDDVNNLYRFVTSSTGGAHTDDEIIYFENPSRFKIEQALHSCNGSEMLMVYFSGHGCRHADIDYVWLNGHEVFPVTSFLTSSKRHVIITDACRTPLDVSGYGDVISGIGFHFPTEYLDLAQGLYWNYLLDSPSGDVFIFSTSEGVPSLDTESGGIYTKSLMTALHNWCYTKNEKTTTLHQIFQRSCTLTKSYAHWQSPKLQYHRNRSAIHLPFGINPKAHLKAMPSYHSIDQSAYYRVYGPHF